MSSSEEGKTVDMNQLSEVSNLAELVGHPIRLEIVRLLAVNGTASWTDIVLDLEKVIGKVNPNTVSFHLSKLRLGGVVQKIGESYSLVEEIRYSPLIKKIMVLLK